MLKKIKKVESKFTKKLEKIQRNFFFLWLRVEVLLKSLQLTHSIVGLNRFSRHLQPATIDKFSFVLFLSFHINALTEEKSIEAFNTSTRPDVRISAEWSQYLKYFCVHLFWSLQWNRKLKNAVRKSQKKILEKTLNFQIFQSKQVLEQFAETVVSKNN